jgi:hypothetical protein
MKEKTFQWILKETPLFPSTQLRGKGTIAYFTPLYIVYWDCKEMAES